MKKKISQVYQKVIIKKIKEKKESECFALTGGEKTKHIFLMVLFHSDH